MAKNIYVTVRIAFEDNVTDEEIQTAIENADYNFVMDGYNIEHEIVEVEGY